MPLLTIMEKVVAKPFVKWAGGKTQLLPEIEKSLPTDFSESKWDTYVEPFVGGGAVLFFILQNYPNIKNVIINDINPKLITAYQIIKTAPESLIELLNIIQDEYLYLSEDNRLKFFLDKRDEYNSSDLSDIDTAALFIFLNKTCFNGLYRVNSKGKFNVPHGKYSNPKICDAKNITAVSRLLQNVIITCGDFAETEKYISRNALFYFDPPYKPISKTASFNSYTKERFDDCEHLRLHDFCMQLTESHTCFLLSNSDVNNFDKKADFFDNLYKQFNIRRVLATRTVSANPQSRGKLSELLITNY